MRYRSILLLLLGAALSASCVKPNKPVPGPDPLPEGKPFWRCESWPSELVFGASPRSGSVDMQSNIKDLKVSSSASWCSCSIDKYDGDKLGLSIGVSAYDAAPGQFPAPRRATVRLTGGSVVDKSVEVVQQCGNISVALAQRPDFYKFGNGYYKIPASGAVRRVNVETNAISWEASSPFDWITLKRNGDVLEISASPRSSGEPRTATVFVCDSMNPEKKCAFELYETDAGMSGEDYGYGDTTPWD